MSKDNDYGATLVQLQDASGRDVDFVAQREPVDASGTVTTAGGSQQALPSDPFRRFLLIQIPSDAPEPVWLQFGHRAVVGWPSIEMRPGALLKFDGSYIPTSTVSVTSASEGTRFTLLAG